MPGVVPLPDAAGLDALAELEGAAGWLDDGDDNVQPASAAMQASATASRPVRAAATWPVGVAATGAVGVAATRPAPEFPVPEVPAAEITVVPFMRVIGSCGFGAVCAVQQL